MIKVCRNLSIPLVYGTWDEVAVEILSKFRHSKEPKPKPNQDKKIS